MEFFNYTTGQWEEAQPPVDIAPLAVARRHPEQSFMHPSETICALLDVLEAARVVDAKFDCGGFSDDTFAQLVSVFGDSLVALHQAVGRIFGEVEVSA